MNTELIAATWRDLQGREHAFVARFYDTFFDHFPRYRALFPAHLEAAHLDKMVRTVALLADLADERADIAPHLRKLAAAHRHFALEPCDFENFREVFIEALSREAPGWTPEAARAWREAFNEVMIPAMAPNVARTMAA